MSNHDKEYMEAYNQKFAELEAQVESTRWAGEPPVDWRVAASKLAHEYAAAETCTPVKMAAKVFNIADPAYAAKLLNQLAHDLASNRYVVDHCVRVYCDNAQVKIDAKHYMAMRCVLRGLFCR